MKRRMWVMTLVLLTAASTAWAQPSEPPPEVGIAEKLGQNLPMDAEIYNESGNLVPLSSIITRPTIMTFVYYECPGICSPLLTELTRIVQKSDLELGKDYQIVTLSFDHRESPALAASKRQNYLSAIAKPVNPDGWHFYTGDSATIRRITDAAGFYFKRDGNDWVHPACLVVLSPTGKVTRYIYGIQYLPFDIKMAVIEASNGKTGPTIAKVLSFCYSYDPEAKSYALNVTRIGIVGTLVLVGLFAFFFIFRAGKKTAERGVRYGNSN